MRPRAIAGIGRMFGKDREAMLGGFGIELAERLTQMVIHSQRALFARLVFDACHDGAAIVDQIDAFDGIDRRQQGEIVFEYVGRFDH
jgi:hypothetical protein